MASSINASTSGGGGVIVTSDATGNLDIQSGGSTVVAVTSTGVAVTGTLAATGASTFTGTGKFATTIGVGNATPAASGSGITFPATQSASSDANTLDDYEEGTWTPSVGGTATYGARAGRYTKIGNIVYIQGQQDITLLGTGSASILSGLPFTAASASSEGGFNITYFANLAVNVIQPVLGVDAATTSCTVYSRTTAGVAASTVSVFGNSARMFFYGHYQVA